MAKNVLIADRGRRGDATAGYTLLDELGKSSEKPPFTIFGVSSREEDEAEARGEARTGLQVILRSCLNR